MLRFLSMLSWFGCLPHRPYSSYSSSDTSHLTSLNWAASSPCLIPKDPCQAAPPYPAWCSVLGGTPPTTTEWMPWSLRTGSGSPQKAFLLQVSSPPRSGSDIPHQAACVQMPFSGSTPDHPSAWSPPHLAWLQYPAPGLALRAPSHPAWALTLQDEASIGAATLLSPGRPFPHWSFLCGHLLRLLGFQHPTPRHPPQGFLSCSVPPHGVRTEEKGRDEDEEEEHCSILHCPKSLITVVIVHSFLR